MGFRVYYEDTDAGGVMYHAQYLAFAERARSEALRSAGATAASLAARHGIVFVVRRVEADYLRPLRLDDDVTVSTALLKRGGSSARLRQTLSAGGVVAAALEVVVVAVRLADMRPVRVPEPWAGALDGLTPDDADDAEGAGTSGF
ncbi:YbgC/FadM family acyl-CoA thioesterase [Acetobacteraceae bacterium KSS12]|uniref:YbgC/FadM family acyl-CoA thioesterase n=1 Tax=Rhizosaccharibacter radicis TaxID=2782605 RepID=A0ABT1VYE8_9PROT|nr:YbgC/FadM family acyl-CoA thioesterase [Acetobacteraceae bacterium KSS12]